MILNQKLVSCFLLPYILLSDSKNWNNKEQLLAFLFIKLFLLISIVLIQTPVLSQGKLTTKINLFDILHFVVISV